jgi:uncharacterized protein
LGQIAQKLILSSSISSRVDPVLGTVAVFVVIATALVIFAEVWLRFLRRGPLEGVWNVAFRFPTRVTTRVTTRVITRERRAGHRAVQA